MPIMKKITNFPPQTLIMKKIILALALVSFVFAGNAQDKQKSAGNKEKAACCEKAECKDKKGECKDAKSGECKHMKSGKQCGKPATKK